MVLVTAVPRSIRQAEPPPIATSELLAFARQQLLKVGLTPEIVDVLLAWPTHGAGGDCLLTHAEAAMYLNVDETTLRRRRRDGKIRVHGYAGRSPRYKQAELDRYLAEGLHQAGVVEMRSRRDHGAWLL